MADDDRRSRDGGHRGGRARRVCRAPRNGQLPRARPPPVTDIPLPHTPGTYLGVYATRGQVRTTGVKAFTRHRGRPGCGTYYSAWLEPFQTSVRGRRGPARRGAARPDGAEDIRLAAIASGKYDAYLSGYAAAVSAYRHPVILSFGHEMNGSWFSWGYRHASPAAFVAAWRHIVTLFRELRVRNVTWLWTVNVIHSGQPPDHRPRPVVARQVIRELGGDRRLLLEAILGVCFPVRADHRQGAGADPRPDPHRRDGRGAWPARQRRSPTCSRASANTGCWGSCGSTPRTSATGASTAPRPPPRSARAPGPTGCPVHER